MSGNILAGDAKKQHEENEYSRLIAAIGANTLKRLQMTKILVLGLRGVGLEVAKNIMLMGARSVTICDKGNVEWSDLSSQFYLGEDDVGKNRADASRVKLAELNPRVDFQVHHGNIDDAFLKQFTVVVCTNSGHKEIAHVSQFCHDNGIHFIASNVYGVFGYIFSDFGKDFEISDKTGEPEKRGFIELISKDEKGLVNCLEGKRHDLEDGDFVVFSDVKGMTELNGKEFKVTVKDGTSFYIGDTTTFGAYTEGGTWQELKKPVKMSFASWAESTTAAPAFDKALLADYSKMDHIESYFLALQALQLYRDTHQRMPHPGNQKDAEEVYALAVKVNEGLKQKVEKPNEKFIHRIARQAAGNISPMAAFFGGIIAQEVIKASSGRFSPLNQWFLFDSFESLPDPELPEEKVKLNGTRYDGQIALFGHDLQQKILNAKYFLVGAGAIGCEMLKNWAMMGVGAGPEGSIIVTDMDAIEVSNLNRQFLYREWDVKHMKSEVAAKAAAKMNPHMNIKALTIKVAPDTEEVYNDAFWTPLTGVCNALDNVPARLYVDQRCIFFRKSLLESGTLGPKGNTQVIVPFLTESYGSTPDPPEKNAPVCLVHSFPHTIEHCLQWARELIFEGRFVADADICNKYVTKPDYIATLAPNLRRSTLETLRDNFVTGPKTFDECTTWARDLFELHYNSNIRQLLHQFPADFKDAKTGAPFWSGAKRPPTPITFDASDPSHLGFIVAATFMRAYNLGIIDSELKPADYDAKVAHIQKFVSTIKLPDWQPKANVKIETDEKAEKKTDDAPVTDEDEDVCNAILKVLPTPAQLGARRLNVIDFEKDDDRNFHIDFIHYAGGLRAAQYKIKTVERLQSKLIAGKIIPAIVTTTASVTGLVCLEFFKLLQDKKLEQYRNTFINLALPVFQQSEPVAPKKGKFVGKEVTLWDRIDIKGDVTLAACLEHLQKTYNLEVDVLGVGSSFVYSSWMPPAKKKERMDKKVSDLVVEITKTPIKAGVQHLNLEVTGTIDDAEVEVPPITLWLKE